MADVAIVLTGMTRTGMQPNDQLHFADGIDRLTESIRLHKDGATKRILLSGGYGSLIDHEIESEMLATMLIDCGVNKRNILMERESRNTFENAKFTARLLEELNLKDRQLMLVTSAFHMRRAILCFSKQDIEVIPYPVDFRSKELKLDISLLIPSSYAIESWKLIIEESVGIAVYRVMGYI